METITGKVLLFTDLHLGLSNNKESKLKIAINAVKSILDYIKENDIKTVFFLGDWNHSRTTTENNTLNVSYKLMSALSKECKVYLILGNHDIYMKNSVDINSLVIFKDLPNVKLIAAPEDISINGNKSIFVPWLSDISTKQKETYDMMFGHFDVSSNFLIQTYLEENKQTVKASKTAMKEINGMDILETENRPGSENLVGNFIELSKKSGTIFSGHIHQRREFKTKGRNFIFVGSPYQQNLGEKNRDCGFYIINENNSYEFHEITNTPKHIELKMSDLVKNPDQFDFSIVKGNIIHKIYDIEIDQELDAKLSRTISEYSPYEEMLPDYDVCVKDTPENSAQQQNIELLKKSKLEYIKNYISEMDEKALESENITKEKLTEVLENYYYKITKEAR